MKENETFELPEDMRCALYERAEAQVAALREALKIAQVELRECGHNAADPFESYEDYTENFPVIAERAFKAASAIDKVLEGKR